MNAIDLKWQAFSLAAQRLEAFKALTTGNTNHNGDRKTDASEAFQSATIRWNVALSSQLANRTEQRCSLAGGRFEKLSEEEKVHHQRASIYCYEAMPLADRLPVPDQKLTQLRKQMPFSPWDTARRRGAKSREVHPRWERSLPHMLFVIMFGINLILVHVSPDPVGICRW